MAHLCCRPSALLFYVRLHLARLFPAATVRDFHPGEYYNAEPDSLIVLSIPDRNTAYAAFDPHLPYRFTPPRNRPPPPPAPERPAWPAVVPGGRTANRHSRPDRRRTLLLLTRDWRGRLHHPAGQLRPLRGHVTGPHTLRAPGGECDVPDRRWGMAGWMQVHTIDRANVEPVIGALRDGARDSKPDAAALTRERRTHSHD